MNKAAIHLAAFFYIRHENISSMEVETRKLFVYDLNMETTIFTLRKEKGLLQKEAAALVGLDLRTYQNYESGRSHRDTFKINAILDKLTQYRPYDESHGVYSFAQLKRIISDVLTHTDAQYAIVFGSYAKGTATEASDVDILIDDSVKGLAFVALADALSKRLCKKVDLVRIDSLKGNVAFLNEVLATGVKAYEKQPLPSGKDD